MAVFLSAALVIYGFVLGYGGAAGDGVLGGPSDSDAPPNVILPELALAAQPPILQAYSLDSGQPIMPQEDGGVAASISDPGQPVGPVFSRENLVVYNVQKGDTLSGIASYFGVSLDTIVSANPAVKSGFLKPGDELNILPTSGIVYRVRDGDTLESISEYFSIPSEKIVQFNKSVNFGILGAGISLVIPGVRGSSLAYSRLNSLPDFSSYFQRPTDGYNWGKLHHYNAVDVSNACGTPVRAAAEGLVIPDDSFGDGSGDWDGGYGHFVLIEHPFGDGVRTRYAHLGKVLVSIGDYVKQGQEVGLMGETGDSTGCHVHFEVYGAANPFARY